MKLTIIIVHWNTPEILKKQLQQIATDNFQIIVVDNASEKSVDWIEKEFPKIEVIKNKFNRGYAFACNQGVLKAVGPARLASESVAGEEWLLFLNPDVEIKPETIQEMIKQATKQNFDACSPMVGEDYQKPLPSWWSLLIEFTPLHRLYDFIYPERIRRMDFKTNLTLFGGCLLIKKRVLLDLGGWDERFFLWFEDSDLTKRLIEKNFKIGWLPQAVEHPGGVSFGRLTNQRQRNIFFHSMDVFAHKHFSWWGRLVVNLIKKRYSSRKLLPELNNNVSITIPNLKKELLEDFFAKNFHTPGVWGIDEEWIVVSSAINESEVWDWRRKYPFIRFIPIKKNSGFASTVNIGFKVSSGNWLGTVNDDIILSKDWLKYLFHNKQQNIGSLNPVIKNLAGEIESAGIQILSNGKALPIIHYHLSNDRDKMVNVVDATNAATVVYAKEALNKTGLFDERFGSYLEDIDLSLRLSRAGYKNIVSSRSTVVHLGQQSSKNLRWKKNWLDFKNWILVILKNWRFKKIIINFPAIFVERLRNLSGILESLLKMTL